LGGNIKSQLLQQYLERNNFKRQKWFERKPVRGQGNYRYLFRNGKTVPMLRMRETLSQNTCLRCVAIGGRGRQLILFDYALFYI
jgi:hypothetical protein